MQYFDSLNTIDRGSLNEQDALAADIFEFLLKRTVDGLVIGITVLPATSKDLSINLYLVSQPVLQRWLPELERSPFTR